MSSRKLSVMIAALAVAAVCVVAQAQAEAAHLQTATHASPARTLTPGFTTRTATARCPHGFEIAAGGGLVADPVGDKLLESYPTDDEKWTVRATRNAGASGNSTVIAYAQCVKHVRLRTVRGHLQYPGGQVLGHSGIICPEQFSPLGAGFLFFNTGFDTSGALSGLTPRNRRVTRVLFSQNNPDRFQVSAVCAKPPTQLVRSTVPLPGDMTAQTVRVQCPHGTKLVGGGAKGTDDRDVLTGSYPAGRRGWEAVGYRIASPGGSTLEATAVCMDR